MKPPVPPLYLARASYRRRRAMDAARLLPFAGVVLFLLPRLWGDAGDQGAATAREAVYLFLVWGMLVLAAAGLSRLLRSDPTSEGVGGRRGEGASDGADGAGPGR